MNTQAQAIYETLPTNPRELPMLQIEVHRSGEVTMHGILANRSLAALRELQVQLASWITTQEENTWGATVWTGELPSVVAWAEKVKAATLPMLEVTNPSYRVVQLGLGKETQPEVESCGHPSAPEVPIECCYNTELGLPSRLCRCCPECAYECYMGT